MLDCTTPVAYNEMKRVMKYVLDLKDLGLKIKPIKSKNGKFLSIVVYDPASTVVTVSSLAGWLLTSKHME